MLHSAVKSGDLDVVRSLLETSHAPHPDNRENILCVAAAVGDVEMTKLLLEYGANPAWQPVVPVISPLYAACRGGHLEVARLLLDAGSSFHKTKALRSSLWTASYNGHPRMVRVLLYALDGQIFDKHSCLWVAVYHRRYQCCEELLETGADPYECGDDGFRTLDCARQRQVPLFVIDSVSVLAVILGIN